MSFCDACAAGRNYENECLVEFVQFLNDPPKIWRRVKNGQELCCYCGVKYDKIHHQGCEFELCPRCGKQMIGGCCGEKDFLVGTNPLLVGPFSYEVRPGEWSLLSKTCLICAQEKPLNHFYSRDMCHCITIRLGLYLIHWLENYLKTKIEVLRGLSSLHGDILDETPRKELIRDIKILDPILKVIEQRFERHLLPFLLTHSREQQDPSLFFEFNLGIEHIDQLGHILANEYKHIRSHDDTYHHNGNNEWPTTTMISIVLDDIKEQVLKSRDDVCIDCLKLYHERHSAGECLVCSRWNWWDEEDFPGWTDFQFSYEIP